jgi:hypothetical protein
MIDHAAIPPGTWHHDPAVQTLTGICARVRSGDKLRCSPGPLEGCSAPGATPAHTAIAAGKAVALSASGRPCHLPASSSGGSCRLQMSASGRSCHLPASSSGEPYRPQVSVSDRQCPVLRVRARSLPERPRLPMAVTGELMRPGRRAIVARPVVKAMKGCALPLPRRAMAALLRGETPRGRTDNAGSNGRFASIYFQQHRTN